MLRPTAILETVLYVAALDPATAFYRDVLGLRLLHEDARMRAFDVSGRGVLLLFLRGGTLDPVRTPFGTIPAHDGSGPLHMAFSVSAEDLPAWRRQLAAASVPIESEVAWPAGGQSLYFRDPDGHCLELATPGLWPGY
ncbi:MAG: VOC family protein [Rhodobacteraceae bacterium]|nr:VOC family protein [Paracoccaceae bacterium]